MRLVPGTRALAEAEISDSARLATLLGAEVPTDWPPESVRDVLPLFLENSVDSADGGRWNLGWYGLLQIRETLVLCGSVGFKGAPTSAGMVEIGYAVLPAYQRRGIATEMVTALSEWALSQPKVTLVEAETALENAGSVRVLKNAGFVICSTAGATAPARFQLRRGSVPPGVASDGASRSALPR
ncbi:MAG: [ribosomal protein S5]-alanine N-acetyltransferase [Myxococcales bacterium]|nr:[ribosomal protein S5]-alanine N-acetyltransferase [Myxococcales bacterium]